MARDGIVALGGGERGLAEVLALLVPLKDAGKYDGLLAQFPWGFRGNRENAQHLLAMRELLNDEPLHVEFRHDSWLTPEVAPWLTKHQLGYCVVDEPQLEHLMPPTPLVTAKDAYVRLHGGNAANWWGIHAGDAAAADDCVKGRLPREYSSAGGS